MSVLLPNKPNKEKKTIEEEKLPLIPVRNMVPFPGVEFPVIFGRTMSVNALMEAFDKEEEENLVIIAAQKNPQIDEPNPDDIYSVGVVCRVEHVVRVDGTVHAAFTGLARANIDQYVDNPSYLEVIVSQFQTEVSERKEIRIVVDQMLGLVRKAFNLGKGFDPEILQKLSTGEKVNLMQLTDQVSFALSASVKEKQGILQTKTLKERIKLVSERLSHEIKVLKLDHSIERKTKDKFEKKMKQSVLEERKKAIDRELEKLGVDAGGRSEIKELKKKIEKSNMPKKVRQQANKELERLAKMSPYAPGASYIRSYIEILVEMPWQRKGKKKVSIKKAKKILDKDHYGLKKVKERILEHLAVMKLRRKNYKSNKKIKQKTDSNGTPNIICFIGPPGVGKTSIGKSIAKALDRDFVRISLGGIRDEAEIRGHRRTYVGSMPGRIIQGIKNAGSKDPVFMLDEIDKVGSDFRGDPSAALLEALDPEQNKEFSDHYLEVPYDLSEVFFILTGNVTDTIPAPLQDRLEIIRFPGYTEEEKLNIAKKYLFPRQLAGHGLSSKDLVLSDKLIKDLIGKYTREAGVRNLERMIAKLCRKVAMRKAEDKKIKPDMNIQTAHRLLGPPKFSHQIKEKEDESGVSTGLAWTESGGEILFIEVALMPGKGELTLTGQLGDVMKESCKAALSYVRSNWEKLGVENENFAQKHDFHIHVPEGAVPKDGPSAGVAIATALVSALTNKKVKRNVGMTGEITLRGRVLEVGGIKEKVLAAHRSELKKVILPKKNKKDLRDVPKEVKNELEFIFADQLSDVLDESIV
jgi:ATP-dependent Lon protease